MKLGKIVAVAAVATTINVAVVQDANAWSTYSTWGNTTYGWGSYGSSSFSTYGNTTYGTANWGSGGSSSVTCSTYGNTTYCF